MVFVGHGVGPYDAHFVVFVDEFGRDAGVFALEFDDVGGVVEFGVGEELIAYEDLGAEALRKLYVEDMPLVVIIDSEGNNLYEEGRAEYLAEHKAHEAEKNA